ncbi:MAG: glucosyltransferase domain-containing protein [Alphaproteobacteria bacterium]|nr:glucosyltransferase domain-containing protein [Alphaproteobacteria bacterium]
MKNLYQTLYNFDLSKLIRNRIKKADKPFWISFFSLFIALNLIFLYHGAHFLFGDHDWRYLKDGIKPDAGLFEGRFSQFIPINLLSYGEILPIINNLLGFLGFSLGIALLARYWRLPHKTSTYVLFTLLTGITPYILSFMYFAFLIIPVLSWNLFIIGALLISEKETSFSLTKSMLAIALITFALGGYPPVINLIGVILIARLLFTLIIEKISIRLLIKRYFWSFLNIIFSLLIYKLILLFLSHLHLINESYYNLQIIHFSEWYNKALLVLKDVFLQFGATLPFITASYKFLITSIVILAVIVLLITKTIPLKRRCLGLFLLFLTFLAGLITLFLSPSIKETEFSPRIDFFGFMYAISASFALLLKSSSKPLKNFSVLLAIATIFCSTHLLFEAQKVWKLGFDSELALYKRIAKRFQHDELFNQHNHYIVVQGGGFSLRPRFYHTPYRYSSDDLLSIAYIPGMASGVMWNYYAPHPYADPTSYVYTFHPDETFRQKLTQAKPWPSPESIYVGGYWILLALTTDGLEYLRQNYLP